MSLSLNILTRLYRTERQAAFGLLTIGESGKWKSGKVGSGKVESGKVEKWKVESGKVESGKVVSGKWKGESGKVKVERWGLFFAKHKDLKEDCFHLAVHKRNAMRGGIVRNIVQQNN